MREKFNILCYGAHSEEVKQFLNENPGFDVNYNRGQSLIIAIRSIEKYPRVRPEKCLATIKTLVEVGVDIHINEDAPLLWALKVNNHPVVSYFLFKNDEDFKVDVEEIENYLINNKTLDKKTIDRLESFKCSTVGLVAR